MGSSRSDRPYLSDDGQPRLRQYLVRAAKAYLCICCWISIMVFLLLYGPPAMKVPTSPGALRTGEVVDAIFGVVLSGGTATVLTIVLAVGVVVAIDRIRSQSADEQNQSPPDATDSMEDETHA